MKNTILILLLSLNSLVFAQIADAPENVSPLLIGEKIPNVKLEDSNGNQVETDAILNQKTVLIVYRGGWCPYCNAQLSEMQEIEKQIMSLGYQIVAVSPDAPKFLKETVQKDNLSYSLYSDSEGKFSQAIGIAYKKGKPKLDKYSEGKNPGFLPVPTVYVLDRNQKIEFLYINPDYSQRLKGKMLLAVLNSIKD